MNEREIKSLEIKAQNLMNLRSTYSAVIIALTGCLFGLLYNISVFNVIVLIIGGLIDYMFLIAYFKTISSINKIVTILRGY